MNNLDIQTVPNSLPDTKACCGCGQVFPATKQYFYYRKNKTGGRSPLNPCIACRRKWEETRPSRAEYDKQYVAKLRLQVLQHYSRSKVPYCACCGEDEYKFMALDHIEGNGLKHRRAAVKSLSTKLYYLWIIKNGFPPMFQVLCHNCNMAKGFHGECPHQKPRRVEYISRDYSQNRESTDYS